MVITLEDARKRYGELPTDFLGDDDVNWDLEARVQWDRVQEKDNNYLDYLKEYLPENPKAVDLGCNIGNWYRSFLGLGADYTGIDASPTAVSLIRKRYPGIRVYRSRLENIGFKEVFDLAFTNTVLQHISLEAKKKILPKIHDALKDGGILAIQEKNDVLTSRSFTTEGWIEFIETFGFKFLIFLPTNRMIFKKIQR